MKFIGIALINRNDNDFAVRR